MGKWATLWKEDVYSLAQTMRRNLCADIMAGYDPHGHSVLKQLADIADYERRTGEQAARLADMDTASAERWAYRDLRRRGAIA